MDRLIVTTLLPIVGLVFGTAALGAELEDGTAVFLLVKPIDRWRIVVAKLIVAVGLSIALVAPASFVAGAILQPGGTGLSGAVGAAVGTAVGATVYATVFFALSLVTGRALAIGLVYVLVWEGVLAGLLEGIRVLSIRQYTLAISAAITHPGVTDPDLLDVRTALVLAVVAVAVAAVIAVRRLSSSRSARPTTSPTTPRPSNSPTLSGSVSKPAVRKSASRAITRSMPCLRMKASWSGPRARPPSRPCRRRSRLRAHAARRRLAPRPGAGITRSMRSAVTAAP